MGAVVAAFEIPSHVSIGVSPTESTPISRREDNAVVMSATVTEPSRMALWWSLESRTDRVVSLCALAFACASGLFALALI